MKPFSRRRSPLLNRVFKISEDRMFVHDDVGNVFFCMKGKGFYFVKREKMKPGLVICAIPLGLGVKETVPGHPTAFKLEKEN